MMRKQCFFCVLLFFFCLTSGTAQEAPANDPSSPDLLYLRDGSVLKGSLLHYVQGEEVWFLISTGDTLRYAESKVQRLVQGGVPQLEAPRRVKTRKPYHFREHGWYHTLAAGIGFGRSYEDQGTGVLSLSYSTGWQISRWLGAGLGAGMDVYEPGTSEVVYPIFAEARGYLTGKNRAPYYAFRLGYGLAFKDEENDLTEARGGILIYPAMGFRWGASDDVNFITDLGFQYQRVEYTWDFGNFGERNIQDLRYKRLVFRLGIVF